MPYYMTPESSHKKALDGFSAQDVRVNESSMNRKNRDRLL